MKVSLTVHVLGNQSFLRWFRHNFHLFRDKGGYILGHIWEIFEDLKESKQCKLGTKQTITKCPRMIPHLLRSCDRREMGKLNVRAYLERLDKGFPFITVRDI
jgi:hypothetical protein